MLKSEYSIMMCYISKVPKKTVLENCQETSEALTVLRPDNQ